MNLAEFIFVASAAMIGICCLAIAYRGGKRNGLF